MTLYDRVLRAGGDARSSVAGNALMETLKQQVQSILSIDHLAILAVENPNRARNEVRSACKRAFEGRAWSSVGSAERERLVEQLLDAVFGFGVIEDLITDETVTEIMINGKDHVFVEREGVIYETNRHFASTSDLRALIDRILGPLGRRVDEASPMVDARLPQGHRVNVVIPPIALDGPTVTIRKFTQHVMTLEEMEQLGSLDHRIRRFLIWTVRARKSIAVVGGTGSGKTTLLNALSCEIDHDERIVTIEDSAELRFLTHPHVVRLEARPTNAEGKGEVTIRKLVMNALRMRPDRIIVGECRGAEALDMLQAMNTGHDGSLTTLHANSPEDSITRLTTMVRYGADLPIDVVEANIASAIDVVVQVQRSADGSRRVTDVVSFSYDRGRGRCKTVPFYTADGDAWSLRPPWFDEVIRSGVATREEVAEWERACFLKA